MPQFKPSRLRMVSRASQRPRSSMTPRPRIRGTEDAANATEPRRRDRYWLSADLVAEVASPDDPERDYDRKLAATPTREHRSTGSWTRPRDHGAPTLGRTAMPTGLRSEPQRSAEPRQVGLRRTSPRRCAGAAARPATPPSGQMRRSSRRLRRSEPDVVVFVPAARGGRAASRMADGRARQNHN